MSDHDEDVTTAIGALVAVLAVISVALRFYSRHVTRTGFKWDDWMILIALAAVIVTDALVLAGSSFRQLTYQVEDLYAVIDAYCPS
jgi:hypothetical protein